MTWSEWIFQLIQDVDEPVDEVSNLNFGLLSLLDDLFRDGK